MATTYNVYRDEVKVASELVTTTYTDTELTPSTTYEYQISATNEFGESALSEVVSVTTDGTAPATPTGLNSTGTTDTTADLEWQA